MTFECLGIGNNKVFLSSLTKGGTLLPFWFFWGQFLFQIGSLSLAHEAFNATTTLKRIREVQAIAWETPIFLLISFLLSSCSFLPLVVTQRCLHTKPGWHKRPVLVRWGRLSSSHYFYPWSHPLHLCRSLLQGCVTLSFWEGSACL